MKSGRRTGSRTANICTMALCWLHVRAPLSSCVVPKAFALISCRPVARISQQWGQKTQMGPHFLCTILDVCSNGAAKHEMGGGYHCPPSGDAPDFLCLSIVVSANAVFTNKKGQRTLNV